MFICVLGEPSLKMSHAGSVFFLVYLFSEGTNNLCSYIYDKMSMKIALYIDSPLCLPSVSVKWVSF